MNIEDFDYHLPPHLIAQRAKPNRADSRLMYLERTTGQIKAHNHFSAIDNYLQPGDVLVLNDTKVMFARLIGKKITGGRVEMLIREFHEQEALAMIQTKKRPQPGDKFYFDEKVVGEVLTREEKGWRVRFSHDVVTIMQQIGYPPLPPYIKRKGEEAQQKWQEDAQKYQTVYAQHLGAIAAPTAGLHFTEELLHQLQKKGVEIVTVTLHVGPGTFMPVKTQKVEEHQMEAEYYHVTEQAASVINQALAEKRRVIAVGTTSCRTLETACEQGRVVAGKGESRIYIYPGYSFDVIDGLLTNFHLPKSTLILLVSALAGRENILQAYHKAMELEFAFYSYGDAMLIL